MNRAGLMRLLVWVAIIAGWEGAYRIIQWRDWIFPAPSHVLDATLAMLNIQTGFGKPLHPGWPGVAEAGPIKPGQVWHGPLITATGISAVRLGVGFVLSILLGGILGAAMWRFKWLDEFLGPLFLGLQTLPSVCWVPLGIILFGLRESGILFVLVLGSFFAIALALRDGLRTIPIAYKNAGRMLGARGWKLYRYVLFPASLPALAASLRQGFSFAWRSLMGAELIFAVQSRGLGFLLQVGREMNDVAQVVAVMIVMVAMGIAADKFVFAKLEQRVLERFGLVVVG